MPYPYQPYVPNWQGQLAAGMQVPQVSQMPTMQTYQQSYNGITKVNGPQSAMQIQLPPNSTSQPLIDARLGLLGGRKRHALHRFAKGN